MAYNKTDYSDPRYKEYRDAVLKLLPINTNEKAKEYYRLFKEHYRIITKKK
jgi:hypothetical protein